VLSCDHTLEELEGWNAGNLEVSGYAGNSSVFNCDRPISLRRRGPATM
jgi:hypothetical protein